MKMIKMERSVTKKMENKAKTKLRKTKKMREGDTKKYGAFIIETVDLV